MPNNLKALTVVLFLAAVTFHLARPIALTFSSSGDFARRRNLWFVLTAVGFLSPSFWIFVLVAVPLLIWAALRDKNVVALYLFLLHVIPPLGVDIPVIGINKLFTLDLYRLLSLVILVPIAVTLRRSRSKRPPQPSAVRAMDLLLLLWGAMQIALFVRPDTSDAALLRDSVTNIFRRGFLFYIDIFVVYYVVSRACWNRKFITEAMAAFFLATLTMAPIAVFETARHWLLYKEMAQGWGAAFPAGYLERAGAVRAMVSAGDALALGYLLAIAFGFWLYLSRHVASLLLRVGVPLTLALGLLAAYSRGPWVGALLIYFGYMLTGPKALSRFIKGTLLACLALGALIVSPLGTRITQVVPFLGGQVDVYNIVYREQLADRSLKMIEAHPVLGDQDAYAKLQDLRQGVGVIDFVNTYAEVAVFYGLLGLSSFVGLILVALGGARHESKIMQKINADFSLIGSSLVACLAGTMLMIYTSSFINGYAKMFYILTGLAAGYMQAGAARRRQLVTAPRVRAATAY